VIVRAPDLALGDLSCQPDQIASANEPRNFSYLRGRVDVVEIENNRVALPAVDARVGHQVVIGVELAGISIAHAPLASSFLICIAIKRVMLTTIDSTAIGAVTSPRASFSVLHWEVVQGFPEVTSGAVPHVFRAIGRVGHEAISKATKRRSSSDHPRALRHPYCCAVRLR
jgi:hypothetical protein